MKIIADHNGAPTKHSRALVNGVWLHYSVVGEGELLFLLYKAPKTSCHWHRVIPLLTLHYTVIAPDLRDLGDLERPLGDFDIKSMVESIAQLTTHLGYEEFLIADEDRDVAAAYQPATQYPERVKKPIFQEMILPGFSFGDYSFLMRENISAHVWLWHINFYSVPNFPETLIIGREREYFNYFTEHETYNPQAIIPDALNEYVRCYSTPGDIRGMCEIYRVTLGDVDRSRETVKTKPEMLVPAMDSEYFVGTDNERQMCELVENVSVVILPWGHQLAEKDPEGLAATYLGFLGRGN